MNCNYCRKELDEKQEFCPFCGQRITKNLSLYEEQEKPNEYWDDINAESIKDKLRQEKMATDIEKQRRNNRKRLISNFIVLGVILISVIVALNVMNKLNGKKLDVVRQSVIGNTFSDTQGIGVYSNGDIRNRTVVSFNDDNTLNYQTGEYIFNVSQTNDNYELEWTPKVISVDDIYDYDFEISIFGKVSIIINNEKYKVETEQDKTVSKIIFYEK